MLQPGPESAAADIIKNEMASRAQAPAGLAGDSKTLPMIVLLAGWLVPGLGHVILRKPIRGGLLFLSIVSMFLIGIGLQGKVYLPNTGDLLDMLNFAGDFGAGALYLLARAFDWGHANVQIAVADYGTKFIVVSGLLNIMAAVDAHSLANGRKAA